MKRQGLIACCFFVGLAALGATAGMCGARPAPREDAAGSQQQRMMEDGTPFPIPR